MKRIHIANKKGIAGLILGGAFLFLMLLGACSKKEENQLPEDYIAVYGEEMITRRDIDKALPAGLSPEDSIRFVKAYILEWIQAKLIEKEALQYVDAEEIDRVTDEYRRQLILTNYRRRMYENNAEVIPEDSIKEYYERHSGEFILDRPMVKGTYLKVADDARNLRILKRLYKSDKPEDADRLEKEVLSSAIHYDYFRDRWIDWEQIETKIPEDFGISADAWLAGHKTLEKSTGGFTYLLYVTEVLPSGSPMPFEAARSQIINRLLNLNRSEYDRKLMNDLYQKAQSDSRLHVNPDIK